MSRSRAKATKALRMPIPIATREIGITLHGVVKSPSALDGCPFPSRIPDALGTLAGVLLNHRRPCRGPATTFVEDEPAFIIEPSRLPSKNPSPGSPASRDRHPLPWGSPGERVPEVRGRVRGDFHGFRVDGMLDCSDFSWPPFQHCQHPGLNAGQLFAM